MSDSGPQLQSRPGKRLRKGAFSCWDCKRRKARCEYTESSTVCNGCAARGIPCVGQDYPEPADYPPVKEVTMGERLVRMEALLQRLAEVKDDGTNDLHSRILGNLEKSVCFDVVHDLDGHTEPRGDALIWSLFDNTVFQAGSDKSLHMQAPESTIVRHKPSKLEKVRGVLLAEFPSQSSIDKISAAGNGWWLIRNHFLPQQTSQPRILGFETLASIVKLHPARIAKALIYLVMGLQHLPSNFDYSTFQLPCTVDEYIERCVSLVSTFLSDDEICGCNNGVEGLFALGIYYSCAGKPRSALLAYRRALNIAQLLGFHRHSVRLSRATEEIPARFMKQLWCSLVGAERQLSLLLGLPYTIPTEHCGLQIDEDEAHLLSPEEVYNRKITPFVSRLVDRTLSGKPPVLATTQELDEELDTIAKSLPDSWWEPPPEVGPEKTAASSDALNRALAHIHHFQFVALLHLPYMLRGDSDRRHQYNRFACLNASREILIRYTNVWKACRTFSCKVIDFQVFTAAVTLLLSLLRQGQTRQIQNEDDRRDWQLVDDLAKTMEDLSHDENLVSTKAAKVIRALQELCLRPVGQGRKTELNIPYFGTVDISVTGNISAESEQNGSGLVAEQENVADQGTAAFPNGNQAFDETTSNSWASFPFTDVSSNSIWGDGPENTQWGLDNAPFGDYFHLDWNQSWNC